MGVFKRIVKSKDGTKTPYWYIRYALNKKTKWESVGRVGPITKSVAQARLAEKKRQIRLGQIDMVEHEIPTLAEFVPEYLKHIEDTKKNRSVKRSKQAINHFSRYYETKKLNEISAKDIDNYKEIRLAEAKKPATVNRELAVIKNLLNQAKKWDKFFGNNPVSRSGMLEASNKIERILTPEEQNKLFEVIENNDERLEPSKRYLKDIIVIALNTGMRQAEILGLRWDWIDLKTNYIVLPKTNTKSKKEHKVPINSDLKTLLLARKLSTSSSEFVFPSPKPNLKPSRKEEEKHLAWVKRSFKTACKRAGIENLRFHDLRHTAATRLVESSIPLHAVSKLLGHSSIRVTERYSHPESSVQEAVTILGNFNHNCSKNCSNERLGK